MAASVAEALNGGRCCLSAVGASAAMLGPRESGEQIVRCESGGLRAAGLSDVRSRSEPGREVGRRDPRRETEVNHLGEEYNSEGVTGPCVEWPSEMRRTPSCMNGTEWGCSRQMSQSKKGTRDNGICRGVAIASNHQLSDEKGN